MSYFSERLVSHMEAKGLKPYKLWKAFEDLPKPQRLSEQYIYRICRGFKIKDEQVLYKLAQIKELNLPIDQLKAWWIIDQLSAEERKIVSEELKASSS
jgi:hypothetical protein